MMLLKCFQSLSNTSFVVFKGKTDFYTNALNASTSFFYVIFMFVFYLLAIRLIFIYFLVIVTKFEFFILIKVGLNFLLILVSQKINVKFKNFDVKKGADEENQNDSLICFIYSAIC